VERQPHLPKVAETDTKLFQDYLILLPLLAAVQVTQPQVHSYKAEVGVMECLDVVVGVPVVRSQAHLLQLEVKAETA
jgi:hypothetical protein